MKLALVTGAYKGLGLAWCKKLAESGYTVILSARSLEKAELAVKSIDSSNLMIPKDLDVNDENSIAQLAQWVTQEYGHIDLIVNNAGINPKDYPDPIKRAQTFELNSLDAKELLKVFEINSIAPILIMKHFRPLLKASGKAKIINISSWLGSVTNLSFGGHYGYIASKNLLNVLNKSAALEMKADNIISVTVNPGWVQTDMGGSKAQFSPEESVSSLIENVLDKIEPEDSGKFYNFDGNEHPW